MKKKSLFIVYCSFFIFSVSFAQSQQTVTLTLDQTIMLAADSSLEAFRSKNLYMSRYWEYRSFKAGRLPSFTLNLTPGRYYRSIVQRYDSESNLDVFRQQQSFYSSGGLSIVQNFDLLGGTFYMNTNLDYMRNFGANNYSQYSSVPIQIGYQQSLFGYNAFKWQKKIEPLKYEIAKKQLIYDFESIAQYAANYFFSLARTQDEYDFAEQNVLNTDSLFRRGEERFKIAAINETDLSTLKLDRVNAINQLKSAEIRLKRDMSALTTFLNLDKNTIVKVVIPNYPKSMEISTEKALDEARNNNPEMLGYKQSILSSQQNVERTRIESKFNASLTASIGFNQVAGTLSNVYHDPLRQDIVSLNISIPVVDWGVRKGRYNMAKNSLNVVEISARQGEIKIEEDVIMTVSDFNIQKDLISSAEEALFLSEDTYAKTQQRFLIGSVDINTLTLRRQSQQQARINYISALESYWTSYFKIRRLTLFDFEYNIPIANTIELKIKN